MAYTEYLDQVQKAYLAYYQRPADPAGQVYWAQRLEAANGNLDSLMNAFAHSEESGRLYGAINNDTIGNVIDAFYQAMFHRAPDAEGKAFYVNGFKSGKFNAGSIALDIINGAQNDDAVSIMNKMAAANFFTQAIDPDMNGEPPYMMTYNAEDEKAARDWLHTITFQSETRKTQSQVVTDMKNLIANAGDPIFDVAEGFVLTNGTDVAISNIFTAGLVYTPGGDDRINSLQDEDVLTGTGDNPTLNATLGNANDNGGTIITPTLKGIETINVAFTGSGGGAVRELDLQDSTNTGKTINITRVSDGIVVATIDNIGVASENLSVSHSGEPDQFINFAFKNSALSGDDDETTLTVKDVQVAGIAVESRLPTAGIGFETINLVSKDEANSIGTLWAEDLETLNISGNADLTLGDTDTTTNALVVEAIRYTAGLGNTQGSLSKIDASAFEANLDITLVGDFNAPTDGTSGVNTALTVIGGKGDDIFRVAADVIGATDLVDGGEGANTMVLLGNTVVNPNGTAATVKNVQSLEVRTGHDAFAVADIDTINADAFDSLANIYVRNEGQIFVAGQWRSAAEGMTVNLNNLTSAQANGITLAHGTTGNSDIANNILNVNLKVATGAADTATLTIVDGVNNDPRFNAQIAAVGVEQVTLQDNDTESNTVHLNQGVRVDPGVTPTAAQFAQTGSSITLKGGQAGKYMNLDSFNGAVVADIADVVGVYDYVLRAGYGYTTDGSAESNTTLLDRESAEQVRLGLVATRDAVVDSVFYSAPFVGTTRHQVENINAADYASDVIVRLGDVTRADGVSSQSIVGGSGNDTFIFDAQNANNSGYTSGDTVSGGAGTDTLVIDGNTDITGAFLGAAISVQKSEWDNTSGIDVLRLAGNEGRANGGNLAIVGPDPTVALNTAGYYIEIDNDFVHQTDAGNNLVIINNDGDLNANTESDLILNLRPLAQTSNVTFIGANGNGLLGISSNRIQLEDNSANGLNKLNGGDTDVVANYVNAAAWNAAVTAGTAGNNNVLEVFNTADVSIHDLSNTKNFGRIEGTNDLAIAQTLKLVLNDTVMDQLVDASHAASATQVERLVVIANNNANVAGAVEHLNIDANLVTNKFGLDVLAGRGTTNTIIGTAGNDKVVLLGNYSAADAAVDGHGLLNLFDGANVINGAALENNGVAYKGADAIAGTADDVLLAYTGTYALGAGDILETFGGLDLTGAVIAAGTVIVAHSSVRLTEAQLNSLGGIVFAGAGSHGLQLVDDTAVVGTTANFDKITVDDVAGVLNITLDGVTQSEQVNIKDGAANPIVHIASLPVDPDPDPDPDPTYTVISVDGKGTDSSPVTITTNLSTGAFALTDNVTATNNVIVNGFGADDVIRFSNGNAAELGVTDNGDGSVTLTYNYEGELSQIKLVGVVPADGLVYDVASFNALAVGDIVFV